LEIEVRAPFKKGDLIEKLVTFLTVEDAFSGAVFQERAQRYQDSCKEAENATTIGSSAKNFPSSSLGFDC
jgi:hypothetical protein